MCDCEKAANSAPPGMGAATAQQGGFVGNPCDVRNTPALEALYERRRQLHRLLEETNKAIETVQKPANADLLVAVELSQRPPVS